MPVRSSWFVSPPLSANTLPIFPLLPPAPCSAQCTAARLVPAATYPPVLQKNTIARPLTLFFPLVFTPLGVPTFHLCYIILIDGNGRIDGYFTPKYDSHTPRVPTFSFATFPLVHPSCFCPLDVDFFVCACAGQGIVLLDKARS